MQPSKAWLPVVILVLSACGVSSNKPEEVPPKSDAGHVAPTPEPARQTSAPSQRPKADTAIRQTPAGPNSCQADIGVAAAARLVAACRDVSPATHPPCNVENSCAMIEDEIARSCAMFDGEAPPMAGCSPAPKSMEAAAAVVQRYYSAINAHDYDTAWRQWGDDGRPGQTLSDFEAGFADTRSAQVTIGRLMPGSGGAGSIYQPVPVTIDATLDDGTRQRFGGTYIVRRVNGVDGASPGQLRWHIESAQLRRVPLH